MTTLRILAFALVATAASATAAQTQQQTYIITGDGWEAFPGVEYQGGDSRFPSKQVGVLVLRDSTLAFHPCTLYRCGGTLRRGQQPFVDGALMEVRLAELREMSSSTVTRSPGVGRRIVWGALANDRTDEFFALAFDTEQTAEAPIFKMQPTQAGALDAKVRFRLRRLGVELDARDP